MWKQSFGLTGLLIFLLPSSLPAAGFTDLSGNLKNFQATIYALGYSPSQDYWLIGGSGGSLAKYDAEEGFVNLSNLTDLGVINCVRWGGTGYWLIGGNNAKLFRYDGNIPTKLSEELNNFSRENIKSIGWNGSEWLIGGDNGRLNEYKAGRFIDLSIEAGFGSRSIETIAWNGSYWLIGGEKGQIRKYEYVREHDRWEFPDLPEKLDFGDETIQSIAWNRDDEYWLIGGGGKVYKYDGTNFENLLNLSMTISSLQWTGDSWLAAGGGQKKLVKFVLSTTTPTEVIGEPDDLTNELELEGFELTPISILSYYPGKYGLLGGNFARLSRFDGENFVNLSEETEFKESFQGDDIRALGWNGEYWLIGGGGGKINQYANGGFEDYSEKIDVGGMHIFTISSNGDYWLLGGEGFRSLFKYNEIRTDPLSPSGFEEEPITTLSWSGEYWLIGGRNGKLNKYDGESLTDLSMAPNFSLGLLQVDITSVVWGSGYWLIGGEDSLNLYDGRTFIDLSRGLISVAGEAKVLNYGGYWLLGGKPARLCRYEEEFFFDLSPQLVNFSLSSVSAIGWNGKYWLIGGRNGKLNKYDGKDFQNLSTQLINFGSKDITSIEWNGSYWLIGGKSGRLNKFQDYPEIVSETKLVLYNNLFKPLKGEKVSIRYNLPQTTKVIIEIYNLWGELSKTLFDGEQISGQHTLDWFGENTKGDKVASGIYLVYFKTKTPAFTETKKVCVIK